MQQVPQTNLFGLPRQDLAGAFNIRDITSRKIDKVLRQIYRDGVDDMLQIRGLSQHTTLNVPASVASVFAADGTCKYRFRFVDGTCVDAILIPSGSRRTLCMSTQAGCPLACAFCATGKQGFQRNLSAVEMLAQIWLVERDLRQSDERVTNVVMMGMGEPLLNFSELIKALSLLRDAYAYDLPRRRVTVSTAGYVPAIPKLAREADVTLAVSLHAPTDELRDRLLPINRKYKLCCLLDACRDYIDHTDSKTITFEYVMLKDINDSERQADQLIALLKGFPAKINLIPFNSFVGSEFETSPPDVIEKFRRQLSLAGLVTTIRRPRGREIGAACGQLNTFDGNSRLLDIHQPLPIDSLSREGIGITPI